MCMVYVCVCAHARVRARVYVPAMWNSKDNFELLLSFHREGPKLKLYVVRLGSRCFYLQSHLSSPENAILYAKATFVFLPLVSSHA